MSTRLAKLTRPWSLTRKSFFWDNQLGRALSQDWRVTGWFARRAGQPAGEFRPITSRDVFNTFHFLWRLPCKIIKYNPRVKTRFEEGLLKKQNKLGHDTGSVSDPLDNPVTYGHTPKDRARTADPGRLSRSQTKWRYRSDQRGSRHNTFGLAGKQGTS